MSESAAEKRRQALVLLCHDIVVAQSIDPFERAQCIVMMNGMSDEQLEHAVMGYMQRGSNKDQLATVLSHNVQRGQILAALSILEELGLRASRESLVAHFRDLGFS